MEEQVMAENQDELELIAKLMHLNGIQHSIILQCAVEGCGPALKYVRREWDLAERYAKEKGRDDTR
jgi:hypothetical protein